MRRKYVLDYNAIGKRIKGCREKAELTQEQLAEKADLSLSHIRHVEYATSKVSLPALINIANVLDVSIDCLICDNQPKISVLKRNILQLIEHCDDKELEYIQDVIMQSMDSYQKHIK